MNAFLAIAFGAILLTPFLNVKGKGIAVLAVVLSNALLSGNLALQALAGQSIEYAFSGSLATGPINLRLDALSGWFILIIDFIFVTGCFYGLFYMKAYQKQTNNITLHGIAFILLLIVLGINFLTKYLSRKFDVRVDRR